MFDHIRPESPSKNSMSHLVIEYSARTLYKFAISEFVVFSVCF